MKISHVIKNHSNSHMDMKAVPNSEILSRKIEELRVVLRRMKTNESAKLDSIINQKLQHLQ